MAARGPQEPAGHRDAVFGLWERGGRILLVRNPRVVGGASADLWDLPGGAVRPGEGLAEALGREWREETGLEARVGDLHLVVDGAKRRAPGAPSLYTWRAFVFGVDAGGEPRPGTGIAAVAWVPTSEVPARLTAPYHRPLCRWLAGERTPRSVSVEWIDPVHFEGRSDRALASSGLRRLLVLAAAAAGGCPDLAAREAGFALAEGTVAARIEEALLQLVPYAGFPRTIAAFAAVRPVLGSPPDAGGDAEPADGTPARGDATFARVYGESTERVATGLDRLHPALRAWTLRFAYGTVLSRPTLTLLERELLAVGVLTALGGLDDPLLGHMRAAVRLGASPQDVAAAVAAVPHAVGEAKRDRALTLLDRLA